MERDTQAAQRMKRLHGGQGEPSPKRARTAAEESPAPLSPSMEELLTELKAVRQDAKREFTEWKE